LELAKDTKLDEIGLNPASIHALWTLRDWGARRFKRRRKHRCLQRAQPPSAGTRRAAAMTLRAMPTVLTHCSIQKSSMTPTRKSAWPRCSRSPKCPSPTSRRESFFDALKQDRNNKDKWIPHAIISAAAKHDAAFLKAALGGIKLDPSQKIDTPKLPRFQPPASEQQLENEQNGKPNGWRSALRRQSRLRARHIGHTGHTQRSITSTEGRRRRLDR